MIRRFIDAQREKSHQKLRNHIQTTVDKYKDIAFPMAAAWKFQQEQKLSSFSDIIEVPEKLGIECQYDEGLFKILDQTGKTYGVSVPEKKQMFLNPNQSEYQEDFTYAHELAHHLSIENEESADQFACFVYTIVGDTREFEEYLAHNPEMNVSIEQRNTFIQELVTGPVLKQVFTISKLLIIPILIYGLIKYHMRKTKLLISNTAKRLWKTK